MLRIKFGLPAVAAAAHTTSREGVASAESRPTVAALGGTQADYPRHTHTHTQTHHTCARVTSPWWTVVYALPTANAFASIIC